MQNSFHIRSSKFPVLPGEEEEITNPGTFGKSFAEFLQEQLKARKYEVPFICCEDWGWWVELKLPGKSIGLCLYRAHDENTECDFMCSPSLEKNRVWSWTKFRYIDLSEELTKLAQDLITIFVEDPEVEFLGDGDEFPY